MDESGPLSSPVVVVTAFVEALNRGDLDAAMAFIAPDGVDHAAVPGAPPGLAGWRHKFELLRTAFPDLRVTIEQSVEARDMVANRLTVRGTHQGPYQGMPATGRTFEVPAMDMIRVWRGRIAEHWSLVDQPAMLAQLTGGGRSSARTPEGVTGSGDRR